MWDGKDCVDETLITITGSSIAWALVHTYRSILLQSHHHRSSSSSYDVQTMGAIVTSRHVTRCYVMMPSQPSRAMPSDRALLKNVFVDGSFHVMARNMKLLNPYSFTHTQHKVLKCDELSVVRCVAYAEMCAAQYETRPFPLEA